MEDTILTVCCNTVPPTLDHLPKKHMVLEQLKVLSSRADSKRKCLVIIIEHPVYFRHIGWSCTKRWRCIIYNKFSGSPVHDQRFRQDFRGCKNIHPFCSFSCKLFHHQGCVGRSLRGVVSIWQNPRFYDPGLYYSQTDVSLEGEVMHRNERINDFIIHTQYLLVI